MSVTVVTPSIGSVSPGQDPFWNNVVLLCKFDNKPYADMSKYTHTIALASGGAASSDVTVNTTTKKYGLASTTMLSQNSYPAVPAAQAGNSEFSFTGDFTMEVWAYRNTIGTQQTFWGQRTAANAMLLYTPTTSPNTGTGWPVEFQISSGGVGVFFLTSAPSDFPINTWCHIAIVRSGTTITMYINGVSITSGTYAPTVSFNSNSAIGLAGTGNATGTVSGGWINGFIDEIRFTNGTARYTSNFVVPGSYFTNGPTQTLLHFDGSLTDSSGKQTWTNNGSATFDSTNKKFGTSSLNLSGASQYISSGTANVTAAMLSEDYTIECWFRATNTTNTPHIWQLAQGTSTTASSLRTALWINTGVLSLSAVGSGGTPTSGSAGTLTGPTVTLNVFHHVAVTLRNGLFTLYYDGKKVGTMPQVAVSSGTVVGITFGRFDIGWQFYGGTTAQNFIGQIDEFRAVAGVQVYTQDFIPPTAPLSVI